MQAEPFYLPIRIYYEDTDFSGFVYHARYLHFFERGRTEALRGLGIDQRAMFEAVGGPFAFAVRRMTIDFRAPARMDDLVTVTTGIADVGGASLVMRQRLSRQTDLLASAELDIVHLERGRPARLAADLRAALAALIER
jgi:acyl-CoA thioester hydrolase